MKKSTGILEIENYSWAYPQNWQELTRRQVMAIYKAMVKHGTQGLFGHIFICIMLGIRQVYFYSRKNRFIIKNLPAEQKITIMHSPNVLGWFFNVKKFPMPYLVQWFWYRGRLYVGPHKSINKLTSSELCFAMFYYQRYHKTQSEDYINKLIDVLYRPVSIWAWVKRTLSSNPMGDVRKPLNDYMHARRAKRFKKLPKHLKLIIVSQWATGQADFSNRYKLAFKASGNKKENPRDMIKFLISAAGDKFGTVEKAEFASAHKVFEHVEMQLEAAEAVNNKK